MNGPDQNMMWSTIDYVRGMNPGKCHNALMCCRFALYHDIVRWYYYVESCCSLYVGMLEPVPFNLSVSIQFKLQSYSSNVFFRQKSCRYKLMIYGFQGQSPVIESSAALVASSY